MGQERKITRSRGKVYTAIDHKYVCSGSFEYYTSERRGRPCLWITMYIHPTDMKIPEIADTLCDGQYFRIVLDNGQEMDVVSHCPDPVIGEYTFTSVDRVDTFLPEG